MANSFYRCQAVGDGLAGAPYLSTLYFDADVQTDVSLVAAVHGDFYDNIKDITVNDLTWRSTGVIQTVDATDGTIVSETIVEPWVHQGTKTQVPTWTAKQGLVAFRTGVFLSGTRIAGRMFVPGIADDQPEQGPDENYRVTLTAAANLMRIDSAEGQFPQVVVRRPRAATTGPNPQPARQGAAAAVTGATVRGYWAVLRSRRD